MMKGNYIKYFVLLGFGIVFCGISYSQEDTVKKRVVDVTSTFKPVLKESAKINFNASPAPVDTTKPRLNYDIPNQNLLFAYQPGNLKPLALEIDTGGRWDMNSYIKAGFGSLKTPFVQAGFGFGDGRTAGLNIYARHIASDGKIDFQDFRNTNVDLKAFLQTAKSQEWNARLGMRRDQYYKYGIDPSISSIPPKDSLSQQFQTWTAGLGFHNINLTEFGLSYSPEVLINVFNDGNENSESNTYINIPLQKGVGKVISVNLGVTFDLTRYKPADESASNNTFYYISPSVLFKTPKINLQAGIRPSWDNKTFKMFPNVMADVSTEDKRFTFQAGWIGYIRRTSYQGLAAINPWLLPPQMLKNTWVEERYAGFKGSAGNHFSYSTKVGFHKYKNQPLFVNDNIGFYDKSFTVLYEPEMKVLHFGAELGYTMQEKFSLLGGLTFNQYTDLQLHDKAYGLIPLEFKAAMRLQVIKDLWIKSDLFAWSGPRYRTIHDGSAKLDGAADLNAGVEFRITKNLNLWAQFNNIFNKEYQRWNLYPSYGFSFLGGIVFNFDQKTQ